MTPDEVTEVPACAVDAGGATGCVDAVRAEHLRGLLPGLNPISAGGIAASAATRWPGTSASIPRYQHPRPGAGLREVGTDPVIAGRIGP